MLGSKREHAQSALAAVPAHGDTTQRIECKGRVLNKTPYLSAAYTYIAVAILVELSDGGEEQVIEYDAIAYKTLALCKPGHQLKVTLRRSNPDNPWYVESIEIVYDIEREKAAFAKVIG